ncbi:integrase catalytic domain-containing protein [Trichonephila clavipes]|nr:integrase catalytic domain-containing protein [Trichonephila clavipes]
MAELLNGLEDFVVPYLDDIAIFSDTWESHIKHMETVLQRIKRAKLTIKPSKCLAGYYQKYINLFSVIAAPLTDALKGREKKGEITGTTECENAFRELKGKLIDKPVLYAPNFEREFIVQTDASNTGMGAVLTQLNEQGKEHPILYLSPQALLYCTRQRFWSLRARSIARKIVHECVVCFKNKPIVANQLLGSLPRERVNPSFPFLHTRIDYCGPFFIRYKHQRKGTYQKIYVAIFVCLASKAVHLEIVSDLTTDAFLATLKRFVARRGKCATISSDNAKNFVGANRELKRLHNLLKFPEEKLSSEGISWDFMPPRAPNFGVLWEAGIEGILNSRPITPLSEDIDDLEVLTPGHFLIGRPITSISEPNFLDKTEKTLSRWQKLTKIVQHIWTKWSRDYLNNLQQRNKWQFHKDNVKLNTMVLIKDDNLPVNEWSLGRITKLVPGTDWKVRVVEIKTNKGNIKRSIGKVCVLSLDN